MSKGVDNNQSIDWEIVLADKYKKVMELMFFENLSLKKACEKENVNYSTAKQTIYTNEEAKEFRKSLMAGGKRNYTKPVVDKALLDDLATNIVHTALTEETSNDRQLKAAIEWLKVSGKFAQKEEKADNLGDYSEVVKELSKQGFKIVTDKQD